MLNALELTVLFCATSLAVIAFRLLTRNSGFTPELLRLFLIPATLPWLTHFWVTTRHCAGWGCDDPGVVPARGLELFAYVSPALIFALLIFFFTIAPRRQRSVAFFPVLAAVVELLALLLLNWQAPPEYVYMNSAADRWLIASSLSAAFFLASGSWFRVAPAAGSAP